jgi:hypothetical protein
MYCQIYIAKRNIKMAILKYETHVVWEAGINLRIEIFHMKPMVCNDSFTRAKEISLVSFVMYSPILPRRSVKGYPSCRDWNDEWSGNSKSCTSLYCINAGQAQHWSMASRPENVRDRIIENTVGWRCKKLIGWNQSQCFLNPNTRASIIALFK